MTKERPAGSVRAKIWKALKGRRRPWLVGGAALLLMASLLAAVFQPTRALASADAPSAAKPVSVSVPAKNWVNTGVNVKAGQELRIAAAGTWTDGNATSGPNGSSKLDADNFFNIADLGVCNYCATTATTGWGALVGYIGASPPTQGSYTSATIRAKAINVFYVGGRYEAKAPTRGRLWLAKNADAYSGYTVDNSGHVTAKVTVLPAQTPSQVAAQARVTALAVKSATPLLQAERACSRAIIDHARDELIIRALNRAGLDGHLYEGALIVNQGIEFYYQASNGDILKSEFSFGKLVFEVIGATADQGLIPPQFEWFGIVGPPLVDCVEAAWWLDGWLGGQVGQYLRQKIWPPTTANAGISGTFTFDRAVLSCVKLPDGCLSNSIVLRFSNCTATKCTMTRSDGLWRTHTIMRSNRTWTAKFVDNALLCHGQQNKATVTIRLIVTSSAVQNRVRITKTLGGTETYAAATNPPNCTPNPSTLENLHGVRS
jgi:hypothetical protein